MFWQVAIVGALIICCIGGLTSCKDGSQGESALIGVTADFMPESPAVNDHFVSMEVASVSGGRITLNVIVTDVTEDVSGIALKINFPGDIAFFEECLDGDLFSSGSCVASQPPLKDDEVFIGRSLIGNQEQPMPVSGSRTVVRLVFVVFGTGSGAGMQTPNIIFQAQNIGGGDATALLDANGDPIPIDWFTGPLMGLEVACGSMVAALGLSECCAPLIVVIGLTALLLLVSACATAPLPPTIGLEKHPPAGEVEEESSPPGEEPARDADASHADPPSPQSSDSSSAVAPPSSTTSENTDSSGAEEPSGSRTDPAEDGAEPGEGPGGGYSAPVAPSTNEVEPPPPPDSKPPASSRHSVGGGASPGSASPPPLTIPMIRMLPPSAEVSVGNRLTIRIEIVDGTNVGSVPFHVVYNPAVLEYESGEEGSFLGRDGRQTAFFAAAMSNGREVAVGLSRLGRGEGVAGAGELCTLTFFVVGPGDAALGFTRAHVRDSTNQILPAEFEGLTLAAR